jgi:precorrin-4 C11-methyltransferase
LKIYTADELNKVKIPNPSDKVFEVTGCYGVAESSAKCPNKHSVLVIEKQKGSMNVNGKISHYTYALACDEGIQRQGHIEIVGAGPGDPDLVSVRGRKFLEEADLILYAGSLVPRELTSCAKPGATVRSSANMNLEEQFELMKRFYDKGCLVVRLHTGDPCIYGAIQEQMNFFDQYGMDYHITPGISSFLAAAAELRSQFTIPEKVQSIILTRGEGRTPMPDKEKLHLLAQSQSTMCIFLSAGIAQQVQDELLAGGYPPETPVACCYKLTWKDQRIFRGKLCDLAAIMKKNKLNLTTMIVVGEAIDNRQGLSKLYDKGFSHKFRK